MQVSQPGDASPVLITLFLTDETALPGEPHRPVCSYPVNRRIDVVFHTIAATCRGYAVSVVDIRTLEPLWLSGVHDYADLMP